MAQTHVDPTDELIGDFVLECSRCGWRKNAKEYTTVWKVGQTVGRDPSDPSYGRCNKCRRYTMVVVKVPAQPPPPTPQGFTRIPRE